MFVPAGRHARAWMARSLSSLSSLVLVLVLAACGTSGPALPDVDGPPTAIGGQPVVVGEAEASAARSQFLEAEDRDASGGRYLVQPPTVAASRSGDEVAHLTVDLDEPGVYTLWARLYAPSLDGDAVYLGLNGSLLRVVVPTLGAYVWVEVERTALAAGEQRIGVGYGEPGVRLDVFALVAVPEPTPADLDRLVTPTGGDDGSSSPPRGDGGRDALSLRGDPAFDAATLPADVRGWYEQLLSDIARPGADLDPMALAARDDVYHYGRTLHSYVQSVLIAFRLSGDLRLLDHVDAIAERMRQELRDGWRDTVDGTDGTRDGYLNWVYRYSTEPDLHGKDTHQSNEMRTHSMLAAVAVALDTNRDLASPAGRDYAASADFWRDYLVNHFEAKWRERRGVPTGFPIMTVPHTHTFYSWTKWHYYMGQLTGDRAYQAEAERMATVLQGELRPISTPEGPAYVWARSVLALGGTGDYLHPTTYARYVFGDVVEFHLAGFAWWASAAEVERFARTFTAFVMDRPDPLRDGGFAADVGGGQEQAGLWTDDSWSRMTADRYRVSSYTLIGAWDRTGRIASTTEDIHAALGSRGGTMLAAGALVDRWFGSLGSTLGVQAVARR